MKIYKNESKAIDLILLDLNMPGMGGYKCLQKLLVVDQAVKVFISSGYMANVHGRDAISSGAKGFIGKPDHLKELAATVRRALDEKEAGAVPG